LHHVSVSHWNIYTELRLHMVSLHFTSLQLRLIVLAFSPNSEVCSTNNI